MLGRVTKLVPSGAFVRVVEGIEGLIHRSELANQHVEPAAVVQVGAMVVVKIIGINLDRRRISLSLKQANEGTLCGGAPDEFDPALYGMPASTEDAGQGAGSTRGGQPGADTTEFTRSIGTVTDPAGEVHDCEHATRNGHMTTDSAGTCARRLLRNHPDGTPGVRAHPVPRDRTGRRVDAGL